MPDWRDIHTYEPGTRCCTGITVQRLPETNCQADLQTHTYASEVIRHLPGSRPRREEGETGDRQVAFH
jgi:hypothetical protein